jgi:hypothetical protein
MSAATIISWVTNVRSVETHDVEPGKVIGAIRSDGEKLRAQVEEIRATMQRELAQHGDQTRAKKVASELKKRLRAVLWSGRFTERANDKLIAHSGLLCADLDELGEQLPEIRKKLMSSPYVWGGVSVAIW